MSEPCAERSEAPADGGGREPRRSESQRLRERSERLRGYHPSAEASRR